MAAVWPSLHEFVELCEVVASLDEFVEKGPLDVLEESIKDHLAYINHKA